MLLLNWKRNRLHLNTFTIKKATHISYPTHIKMNFFGKDETPKPAGPDPMFAAKTEMEMYTHLFNKMASTCFEKCASRKHKEDDLALGEMSCSDRCVSKYLEAQEKVGVVLQKANEAQLAQQQNLQNMQNALGGGR